MDKIDGLIKNITSKKITGSVDEIYNTITTYYKTYNSAEKIKNYTYKITTKKPISIVILRDLLLKILRQKSNIKIKENISDTESIFYVKKVNDTDSIKILISYCILYLIDSDQSLIKNCIGIDFEFNQQKISLCQLGFFP